MKTPSDSVLLEWANNNSIIVYTLTSASINSINAWSKQAIEIIRSWDQSMPYKAIHDLSTPGVGSVYTMAVQHDVFNIGVTPDNKELIEELFAEYELWEARLALVVSPSMSGQLARLRVINSDGQNQKIDTRIFFNREQALNWLNSE